MLITTSDTIPTTEYFQVISVHFLNRKKLFELTKQLDNYAQQFRIVQKRLLVRYKDRNPTPLVGLDIILKETYEKILLIGFFFF
jgi:Bardet-Biedl syndrome 9 protein